MILIGLFAFFFALTTINAQCTEGRETCNSDTPRINSETPSLPDVTNHPNLRLLDPTCGPITLRVTDSNKTGVFEFPWMAQLMYYKTEFGQTNLEFRCSGTIISSQYILTAAHCVTQDLSSTYRLIGVRVGDHDLNTERDCDKDENGEELECAEKYQEFGVESVHYHPEYSITQKHNDIALIRLNFTIDFKPLNVKPICLPYGTAANLSQRKILHLTTSGWGRVPFGLENQVLLKEKLSLIPHEQCKEMYKPFNKTISHKELCASSLNYADLCVGDRGGPLQAPGIYDGRSARIVQYGVTSYGLLCNSFVVYTNVAYYMNWILDTMIAPCTEGHASCINFSQQLTTTTMTSTMTPKTDSETPSLPDVTNHPNLRLLDSECGWSITHPVGFGTRRIYYDNKTEIFDFPWMALIAYDTGRPNPEFRCSGTLISSRYVLTAAQCVTSLPPSLRLIGVRIGDHDTSKERDCNRNENGQFECSELYQEFGVESVHYHPQFTRTKMQNDIALIRLNSSVDFRPLNVKSICLPYDTAANLIRRRHLRVTGWATIPFGQRSQVLLQENPTLRSHELCKKMYLQYNKTISYKQLCASNFYNKSTCLGDVGGPLQGLGIYNGSTRFIQYGIVSYGLRQCDTHPDVYTEVAYYMDWILDTMTES